MRIALLGFTPREEVIARTVRKQDSKVEIVLFTLGKNQALEEVADRTYSIDLGDVHTSVVKPIRSVQPDIVLLGPDKLSICGVADTLRASGIPLIGSIPNRFMSKLQRRGCVQWRPKPPIFIRVI